MKKFKGKKVRLDSLRELLDKYPGDLNFEDTALYIGDHVLKESEELIFIEIVNKMRGLIEKIWI